MAENPNAPTTTNPPPVQPPGGPNRAPRPAKPAPQFAFLVEVAGAQNENILCPIDNHHCRGRWDKKNVPGSAVDGEFSGMPVLPGICFVVNTAKRIVRRFDPLADEDNAKLLKRAQRIVLATQGVKMAPEKAKVWKDRAADDSTLKTFCFWLLKMRDAGHVQVLKGTFPEFEDILKMPGEVQGKQFDQLAGITRGIPNEQLRYVSPADLEQEDAGEENYNEAVPDPVINADGFDTSDEDDDE